MMQQHHFQVFADYHQFYVQDDDPSFGDLSKAWSEEAVARLLAVAPHVVGVGTVRNTHVPVTVEIHDTRPQLDLEAWDRVNLVSLAIDTGRLVVAGCTGYFPDAARIDVTAGTYEVLVCYAGLRSVSADGLTGNDTYHLYLYPGKDQEIQVLKSTRNGAVP